MSAGKSLHALREGAYFFLFFNFFCTTAESSPEWIQREWIEWVNLKLKDTASCLESECWPALERRDEHALVDLLLSLLFFLSPRTHAVPFGAHQTVCKSKSRTKWGALRAFYQVLMNCHADCRRAADSLMYRGNNEKVGKRNKLRADPSQGVEWDVRPDTPSPVICLLVWR